MYTTLTITDNTRKELTSLIVDLVRRLDAYFATGRKDVMTVPDKRAVVDFGKCDTTPMLHRNPGTTQYLDSIATGSYHEFYVSTDDLDLYEAGELGLEDLVNIAGALEATLDHSPEIQPDCTTEKGGTN